MNKKTGTQMDRTIAQANLLLAIKQSRRNEGGMAEALQAIEDVTRVVSDRPTSRSLNRCPFTGSNRFRPPQNHR